MPKYAKQPALLVAFLLTVLALSLTGCGPERRPAAPSPKPTKEDRALEVVKDMRHKAVSDKVGRWAVVIGISDYKYDIRWDQRKGIPDLRFADRDARAFAKFLMSPQGGAFPPDHVLLLTDRKATVNEVRNAIGGFLAKSLEDDLVIIFFAGHGVPDPDNPENLYLACYDTQPGKYYGTAFPMWGIDDALRRTIHSKRVFVFADACHSAGVGGARGKSVSKKFNEYMDRLAASKEGVTKITASRADELSLEKEHLGGGHGVFTYYLLEALGGSADENQDGFVTMTEAYDYLYDKVRSETQHSQKPWASGYVSSDIPLGIVDSQVLAAVKARAESQAKKSAPLGRPYRPSPVAIDMPKDSGVAIKLAMAKLAKDEPGVAREMVEGVIRRNDSAKPDALALKIEILLRDQDLREAEDTEDLLVIPYPTHPAAKKGAQLVYNYYLKEAKGKSPADQIQQMETYLRRHPAGILEQKAREKLKELGAEVRSRYDRTFKESLILAQGFINQNRFERARKELQKAQDTAGEALSAYGISLDTSRISALRLKAETEEQQYRQEKAYQDAKNKAGRQSLEEKIKTWQEFATANPGNPYVKDAEKELSGLRQNAQVQLQARYNNLLGEAKTALNGKNFARSLERLDAAADLFRKAGEGLGISLNQGDIYQVKERHRAEAEKQREYMVWHKADSEAKGISLNDSADYDRRISTYEDFRARWPGNPYGRNAEQVASELRQQKTSFMVRKFREYFGRAKDRFIAKNYTAAYESLEYARKYATSGQKKEIDDLARRYNAPPEVRIVMDSRTVNWDTPVRFKYRATDKEGDSVRAVSWDFGDGTTGTGGTPVHTYDKWGSPQKERHYVVSLKATDEHTTVVAKKAIVVKRQDCSRDGRYCKYANGIVKDTRTGLEWMVGPDRDTNWDEARSWVQSLNLDGGGWRMPTTDELKTLYKKGTGSRNMTPLLETTGWYVWSGETKGSSDAWSFYFYRGDRAWAHRSGSANGRAFAVRSRSDG